MTEIKHPNTEKKRVTRTPIILPSWLVVFHVLMNTCADAPFLFWCGKVEMGRKIYWLVPLTLASIYPGMDLDQHDSSVEMGFDFATTRSRFEQ